MYYGNSNSNRYSGPAPTTKYEQSYLNPGTINYVPEAFNRPVTDASNLSSLFGSLNKISSDTITGSRSGGGTGGGSQGIEGNMDPNPLSRFNEYLGDNVTGFNYGGKYRYNEGGEYRSYDQGGQLTPKEMKKVQGLGRNGDTQLAHINPQEAQMLKQMGGSGTINPYTGLREYGFLSNFLSSVLDPVSDVMGGAGNVANDLLSPIFNAAGDVLDPIASGLSEGVQYVGDNVVSPIVEGVASGTTDVIKGIGEVGTDITRGVGGFVNDIYESLLGGGSQQFPDYSKGQIKDPNRDPALRSEQTTQPGLKLNPQSQLSRLQKDKKSKLQEGDWVGDKPNPYIAPNVEEELDYAARGMKMPMYNQGGMYEQAANQAIAQNQLSGLAANLQNRNNFSNMIADNGMKMPSNEMVSELQRMIPNPQDAMNLVGQLSNNQPMANYGMKRKYQEGGNYPHDMFNPETGYKIVAKNEAAHNKLNAAGFDHTPKAAYGMKKRYTQGGRF